MVEPPGNCLSVTEEVSSGLHSMGRNLWGLGSLSEARDSQGSCRGPEEVEKMVLNGWSMGWDWLWCTETQPNLPSDSPAPLSSRSPSRRMSPSQHQIPQQCPPQHGLWCGLLMLPDFVKNPNKLKNLVAQICAKFLYISRHLSTASPLLQVTYMHMRNTHGFSLDWLAHSSQHDHPGMHTVLKALHGTVHISCMEQL
jgi:hypothetical protein